MKPTSRKKEKDQERDQFLQDAGFRTIHWNIDHTLSNEALQTMIDSIKKLHQQKNKRIYKETLKLK